MRILTVETNALALTYEQAARIDQIMEACHLELVLDGVYLVKDGWDEDRQVRRAAGALRREKTLKDQIRVGIGYEIVRCRLDEVRTEHMKPPRRDKYEHYKAWFEGKTIPSDSLTCPNIMVVNERRELMDGYVTWLLMKERGMERAEFLMERSGTRLKKYVRGVHLSPKPGKEPGKEYTWAYPLRRAVVPGDVVLAETRYGDELVRVTQVGVATARYVDGRRKVKRVVGKGEVETDF